MLRITVSGIMLGLLLLCTGGVLLASEADELRERAQVMRKKASAVAEKGNKELAERLERESVELLEAAERMELKAKGNGERQHRPGIDKEMQQLKGRLQDLLAKERKMQEIKAPEQELAEVREQISGTERELKRIHAHHAERGEPRSEFREQEEKLEAASRRIHHLRVAAENLEQAAEHDLAHKLMEKAEEMERDVQEARERLVAERHAGREPEGEHGPEVVRELRAEIERLRAEVKELNQRPEKR